MMNDQMLHFTDALKEEVPSGLGNNLMAMGLGSILGATGFGPAITGIFCMAASYSEHMLTAGLVCSFLFVTSTEASKKLRDVFQMTSFKAAIALSAVVSFVTLVHVHPESFEDLAWKFVENNKVEMMNVKAPSLHGH